MGRHGLQLSLAVILLSGVVCRAALVLQVEQRELPGPVGLTLGKEAQLLYSIYGNTTVFGYYIVDVGIGTPSQYFQLLIDTGSSITHVPSRGCGDRCTAGLSKDYGYLASASNTSRPMDCGDACAGTFLRCETEGRCGYDIRYGGNAASSGNMFYDLFYLSKEPHQIVANMSFGAETQEMGPLQSEQVDGMMGINQAPTSFISQLRNQGVVNASFAMCWQSKLSNTTGKSYMLLGSPPAPSVLRAAAVPGAVSDTLQYSPLLEGYTNYYVKIEELKVGDEALDLGTLLDLDYDGSANDVLVDSGTTFTMMPTLVQQAVKAKLLQAMEAAGVKPKTNQATRTCWEHPQLADLNDAEALRTLLPELSFQFIGGAGFVAGPENYLFRPSSYSNTTACLSVFASSAGSFVVGNTIRQRVLSHYDIENQVMGFLAVTDCQEVATLWLAEAGNAAVPGSSD